jgi:3-mercaptopyruvate sulfurtransferase SseA
MALEMVLISTEELSEMLDSPDVIVLDVRSPKSFEGSDLKIMGSVRESPAAADIDGWAAKYPKEKTMVPFCA